MGKFTALERNALTQAWSLEERAALAYFLEEKKMKSGSLVSWHASEKDSNGKSEKCLYFIDSGSVRITYETVSVELHDNDSFGELSLIADTKKIAPVMATKDCTLWVLSAEKWSEMKKGAPSITLKLLEAIVQKFARLLNETSSPRALSAASAPPAN